MKKILLLLALITNLAFAECNINQASNMTSTHKVGAVTDLTKNITPGKCIVKYRIDVDNDWHNVTWEHNGAEDGEFLCNTAIENGRKQLFTALGGQYEAESIIVCKEGKVRRGPVKIGDEVLETELPRVPEKNQYFKYNNATCRLFREKYNNGVLRINHGVICKADNELWTVVDKW